MYNNRWSKDFLDFDKNFNTQFIIALLLYDVIYRNLLILWNFDTLIK